MYFFQYLENLKVLKIIYAFLKKWFISGLFPADGERKKAKRKKTTRSKSTTPNTKKPIQKERQFTCGHCIDLLGGRINNSFAGDPDGKHAPDPRQTIPAFSSFEAMKNHFINDHDLFVEHFCEEKGCLEQKGRSSYRAPHGEITCKICDLSFKLQKHHDQHVASVHADHEMTNKQFYDLYLKYENSYYDV